MPSIIDSRSTVPQPDPRVHYRRAPTPRGRFPTEESALNNPYLVIRGMDLKAPEGMMGHPLGAVNVFALTLADRMPAVEALRMNGRNTALGADPHLSVQ